MSTALDQQRPSAQGEERRSDAFATMVARLSRLSVDKHADAYADIAWDDPEMALEEGDPRLELPAFDPLAATAWYQAQPPAVRSLVGRYRYAAAMRIGWHFENLLQQGLLRHALWMSNHVPEFRYLQHEIIEEGQHTLMFQELVDRSGLPVRGMSSVLRQFAQVSVVPLSRAFPALFFTLVLGGEEPIDHLQRRMLREDGVAHPLIERITRIHVTEEARHVSFARQVLERDVPRLDPVRRHVLATASPVVLGTMARLMVFPPGDLLRHCGVPRSAAREARRSPAGRQLLRDSVAKPRRLLANLGLVNPVSKLLWRAAGVWDEPTAERRGDQAAGTRAGRTQEAS